MTTATEYPLEFRNIQPFWIARFFLIAYAVVLPIRGTASLQSILLLTSFALLLWERRSSLRMAWSEAWWVLGPLFLFSFWVFATSGFWDKPEFRSWDPKSWDMHQPWYSLDQWRRDIGQPMIGLLCGFWVFRDSPSKKWLFTAQAFLIVVLTIKCLCQFYFGELVEGSHGYPTEWFKGTLQVRGFSHDNIFFSYVLLLLTPCVLWLIAQRQPGWRGWMCAGLFLLLFYLIFLNKRRGTWLAVYVELLLIAAWMGKRPLIAFIMGTLIMGLAAWQFRPYWFEREYDTQAIGRVRIFEDMRQLAGKHPWVGVGFGKDTVVKHYWHQIPQHAHNTFANMVLAVGFPGLALWGGALFAYGRRFWRMRGEGWSFRIGLVLLIAFCVRNFTDDVWIASNAELFWFLMGVFMPGMDLEKRVEAQSRK